MLPNRRLNTVQIIPTVDILIMRSPQMSTAVIMAPKSGAGLAALEDLPGSTQKVWVDKYSNNYEAHLIPPVLVDPEALLRP